MERPIICLVLMQDMIWKLMPLAERNAAFAYYIAMYIYKVGDEFIVEWPYQGDLPSSIKNKIIRHFNTTEEYIKRREDLTGRLRRVLGMKVRKLPEDTSNNNNNNKWIVENDSGWLSPTAILEYMGNNVIMVDGLKHHLSTSLFSAICNHCIRCGYDIDVSDKTFFRECSIVPINDIF